MLIVRFVVQLMVVVMCFHAFLVSAKNQTLAPDISLFERTITAPVDAPNIVLVLTDDVGFASASTFGGPVPTPNLDKLAANGLLYNRFHTTAICSPTRASLLTGRNHHAVGMGTLVDIPTAYPGYTAQMPPSAATVARVLRDNGYNTAMFGKWHLGENYPFRPQDQGFNHVLIHGGGFIGGSYRAPEITGLATRMASRGYVVASIQYRMGMHLKPYNPTTTCGFGAVTMSPCAYALDSAEFSRAEYRAQQDAKGAIRFMKNRNALDSTCTSNVFLMGHSAGAITSLLATFLDKPSEKLPYTDSIASAPVTSNPCTDNNPCGSTSLLRPALGRVRGTIALGGHDESVKGVFAFAGALPNLNLLDNHNDSLLVYTFHQDCDPIVYYRIKAPLRDVSSCMSCAGCSGLPPASIHYGGNSIADTILAKYTSYNLKTDFMYRNKPINCYYGLTTPDATKCWDVTDCSFCANNNYHNCHDIVNVEKRIDTVAKFLFDNMESCNNSYVGINEIVLEDYISLYPNPADNQIQLEVSSHEFSVLSIELISITGKLITSHRVQDESEIYTLDIRLLTPGVYLVNVRTSQGVITKKFVKG